MIEIKIEDNAKKGRFVLLEEGKEAGEMTFTWAGEQKLIIDHTGIGEEHGGKGYGKMLLAKAVEFAREKDIKVIPLCPFAKAMIDRDPSIQDILA